MKLEDKRTFEDVAFLASKLKGGNPVDKFDLLIGLLMIITKSEFNDSEGVYIIKDPRYKKGTYTREELINEFKTDVIRGKKYKFDELNNRLERTRKYIKKQLEKSGIKFEDVILIKTDKKHKPSERITYYQYVDPNFDLMKLYVPAINEDADTTLMEHIDRRYNLPNEPNIENIRNAFSFQERYSQSLKNRIISAIKEIDINKDPIQALEEGKFIKTLEYALLLNEPIKIACLMRRYVEFFEARESIVDLESKSYSDKLVYDCINVIEKQLGNAAKDLDKISNGLSSDELFGENEEIFESVIYYLRSMNSLDLPDALFSYGRYCVAISNYGNAEKSFKECFTFYDENDLTTAADRLILHNNLGNLYGEWYHLSDAYAHIKQSIELIERCAKFLPEEPNYILSMSYNTLASICMKSYEYDKADLALEKARYYIETELNKKSYTYDAKIEYHSLALQHNIAFFNYEKGDDLALLSLELPIWKGMLLSKKYPTNENLLLQAILNISYANGLLKIESTEDAMSFTYDAIEIYDELCNRSYKRYALAKTYGLQRLADVYECRGDITKAISILRDAQKICEKFDLGINFEARKRRIEILNNLAGLFVSAQQYKEAICCCEEIIREYKEFFTVIDYVQFTFEMLKELDNLAIAYYYNGNVSLSHARIQEALIYLDEIHDAIGDELFSEWKVKILNDLSIMK